MPTNDKSFLADLTAEWKAANDHKKACKKGADPEALKAAEKACASASKKLRDIQKLFLGMPAEVKDEFLAHYQAKKDAETLKEISDLETEVRLLSKVHDGLNSTRDKLVKLQARLTKLRTLVAAT